MELALNNGFFELSSDELELVEGGSAKVAAAIFTIAAGACFVVSGVAALCGNDKVAAVAGIAGGTCGIIAGCCALAPAP